MGIAMAFAWADGQINLAASDLTQPSLMHPDYCLAEKQQGNFQSEAFWLKNHFEKTGVENQAENYVSVFMQRRL